MNVDPPPILQFKSNNDEKPETDCVKNKLHRDHTSEMSDLYEFEIDLFDHGEPEELMLFIRNLQITIKAPLTLTAGANIQYICTILCGEALHQIDTLYTEVESATSEHLKYIILGLGTHFYPVNTLSKQKHTICCGMRKPHSLKVRRYAAHMIDLNNYLAVFPREKASVKTKAYDPLRNEEASRFKS